MATAAEKRGKLEARLAKINPALHQARLERATVRAGKLKDEIASTEKYKDYEGRGARWQVSAGMKVEVIVLGYERRIHGHEMFRVQPVSGEGTAMANLDDLEIEGVTPPVQATPTASVGAPVQTKGGKREKREKEHPGALG